MLNLLPPENKEKYRAQSIVYGVSLTYIIIAVAIYLGGAAFATFNLTKQTSIGNAQEKLNALSQEKTKNTEIANKAALVEDRVKNRSTYQDTDKWDKILESIANDTPTNVQITSIKTTTDSSNRLTISILGKANERRAVVLFQDKLSNDKTFTATGIQSINQSTDATKTVYDFTVQTSLGSADAAKK